MIDRECKLSRTMCRMWKFASLEVKDATKGVNFSYLSLLKLRKFALIDPFRICINQNCGFFNGNFLSLEINNLWLNKETLHNIGHFISLYQYSEALKVSFAVFQTFFR